MIDGLIGGKLQGKPAQRVGQSGKAFVTAKVRTPTANGETLFVNVIAFSESVGASLLALDDGDSVSIPLTIHTAHPPSVTITAKSRSRFRETSVTLWRNHRSRSREIRTFGTHATRRRGA